MDLHNIRFSPFIINDKTKLENFVFTGDPDNGKSGAIARILEQIYSLGKYKILDLYDSGRFEGAFWCLPSKNKVLQTDRFKYHRPMAYPTEILMPISKELIKYGRKTTNTKLFQIPVNTISEDDVAAVLGRDLTKHEQGAVRKVMEKADKNTSPLDFRNMLLDMTERIEKVEGSRGIRIERRSIKTFITAFLDPLMAEKLFCSGSSPYALDIKQVLKSRKIISVLAVRHLKKQWHGFIVNYFLNRCREILFKPEIYGIKIPLYIAIREAANIIGSRSKDPAAQAIVDNISSIFKEHRTGQIYFQIDSQLTSELASPVATCLTTIVFRTTFIDSVKEFTGAKEGTGFVTRNQMNSLPYLKQRECLVLKRDFARAFHTKIALCRHRLYKTGDIFYDIWEREGGKFHDLKEDIDKIIQTERRDKERWKEIYSKRKDRDIEMASTRRKTDEERELKERKDRIDKELELDDYRRTQRRKSLKETNKPGEEKPLMEDPSAEDTDPEESLDPDIERPIEIKEKKKETEELDYDVAY